MKPVYYNEWDKAAAAWLRELIKAGLIAPGDVDERSITDVRADDLAPYGQCHFFAGIGGWSYAARLAGIPDDYPLWTGSCPCQPFSAAGQQRGTADERHLWPELARLIAERRPAIAVGEQVASALGRSWLSGVFVDMEALGYATAAADLCAAGVGAPHIRQRLYWIADADKVGREMEIQRSGRCQSPASFREASLAGMRCAPSGMGDANGARSQGWRERGHSTYQWPAWSAGVAIPCADGKSRRIESGIQPLANGVPARVGRLRGYGNAIVPQVAATFLKAAIHG